MINANELRIGNLVKMPFLGDVNLTVFGLAVKDDMSLFIQSKSGSGSTFFENPDKYAPIPINEEWIFKLGFEEDGHEYTLPLSPVTDLNLSYGGDGYGYVSSVRQWDDNGFDETHQVFIEDTKYVHQLQNLYFSLSGEELTFDVS